jgi:Tfp pilus assembly protein PilO
MADQPKKFDPALQVEQAKKFLLTFYEKPIAQVSTELFFTIAATIFFAAFAIRPTIITMTELVKEIEDKRKTVELLKRKVAALSTVQNQYFTLQDRFYLLDETVPTVPAFERTLKIIERVASDLQISITSMQIQTFPVTSMEDIPFSHKKPQLINVTLGVTGSYQQIRSFTDQIGNLRPLLTIDSISVSSGERSESQDFLTATFTIQGYYYGKDQLKEPPVPGQREVEDDTAL